MMEPIEWDDVPCHKIIIEVYISGYTQERAQEHITKALLAMKSNEECDLFDWDFIHTEEA